MQQINLDTIPGMIESQECYELIRASTGKKIAVDIGALCGKSTFSLAVGAGKVIAVDPFKIPIGDDFEQLFRRVTGVPEGESFRHVFDKHTAPIKEKLNVFECRVQDFVYDDPNEIGVLHVDCSAEVELHLHVASHLYPEVEVGGYIFHQDFWWCRSWYLAGIMRKYEKAGYVQRVGDAATTRIYKVIKKIPKDFKFVVTYEDSLDALESLGLLSFKQEDIRNCIKVFLFRKFQKIQEAAALAKAVAPVMTIGWMQEQFRHACQGTLGSNYG